MYNGRVSAPLVGPQHRKNPLIDLRRQRFDAAQNILAFGGEADRIHAGVAPRALSLQQALLDEPAHDVGERGAIDARLLDQAGLAHVGVLGDANKHRELAGRQIRFGRFIGEEDLGALSGAMQKMQR